jgi:cytochrome b involved in lipid metabolism
MPRAKVEHTPREVLTLTFNDDGQRVFSREEVARHNRAEDCWLIVHERVYNVSSWVDDHPGGDIIGERAGLDATDRFEGHGHSGYAHSLLDKYFIGVVDRPRRYTVLAPKRGYDDFMLSRP